MTFEWQTEEDWDELIVEESVSPKKKSQWLVWLTPLLLLGIAGIFLFTRLTKRVETVNDQLTNDIQSSFQLIRTAVDTNDMELFVSMQSGRDLAFASGKQTAFEEGWLFNFRPMGMEWQPESSEILSIALSSDLSRADVVVAESYLVAVGNGVSQTIKLTHIETYRPGEERWLWAPTEMPEVSEREPGVRSRTASAPSSYTSPHLTLTTPFSKTVLTQKLALDLENKLTEACTLMLCPPNLHIELELSTDVNILSSMNVPAFSLLNARKIILPAPIIIGLPVDEAAYQALLRGYVAQVVTAAMLQVTGWQCCEHQLIAQPIIDKQLAQLGIRPWPLSDDHYRQLYEDERTPYQLVEYWQRVGIGEQRQVDLWQPYGLIDFILQQNPTWTPAGILQAMTTTDDYWQWLSQFTEIGPSLGRNWDEFVRQKAAG